MKTAIITGGAIGIGKAVTSVLASNGYNVVVCYNKMNYFVHKILKGTLL